MKKILLVEDDPLIAEIYVTKFQEEGFTIVHCKDGERALKTLKRNGVDFILLDLVLPRINGFQFLDRLNKVLKGKAKRPKIFVFSNVEEKDQIQKTFSLGVDKYLIKAHYTPSQIVEEVKKNVQNNGK